MAALPRALATPLGALLLLGAGFQPGFADEAERGVATFGETITVQEDAGSDRPGVVERQTLDEAGQPPATQAAEAAAHLPGVNVEGELGEADRVLVRGAEARLVSTTLDGERLPSPDGEMRSSGLSLIPAQLLEEVAVGKTLSPDRDADAIGGTVDLVTRRAPSAGLSTLELTGGAAWPSERPLYGGNLAFGRRLLKGRLGLLAAVTGESAEREVDGLLARYGDEGLEQTETQAYELFQERLGALATIDWAASASTALELRGLYGRNQTRELRRRVKNDLEDDLIERELKDADLLRELLAVSASGSRVSGPVLLEASLGSNAAVEREPDRVDTSFVSEPASEDPAAFLLDKIGVEDNATRERNLFATFDLSWSVFKAGAKVRDKDRRRDLGMTLFHPEEEISLLDWSGSSRIDPERARRLLESLGLAGEQGLAEEAADYRATETTAAAYAQAELKLGRLTLLPGVRHERTWSEYRGFELTAGGTEGSALRPLRGESSYGLWLPMLHAALALREGLDLHAALTRGFARPDYFDLVPYRLLDAEDLEIEEGNAGLRPTRSWNLDGRLDRSPAGARSIGGSIGAGVFYRDLTDFTFVRRRRVELDGETWDSTRPENGERARLYGGEIVMRWRLPQETGPLAGWGFQASSIWTRSEAWLTGEERTPLRLPGQAPWAGSLALSYDRGRLAGTLAVTWAGPSLAELGTTREEDLVRDDRHRLDLALSYAFASGLRWRLEAMNLTDDPLRMEFGASGRTAREESYGRSLRCSFSADF